MATNYMPVAAMASTPIEHLHSKNIAVGDPLVQARWSYSPPAWAEIDWTVTKILKNRVVLTRRDSVETKRVLLRTNSVYAPSNGEVLQRFEGQSDWSRERMYLFTPDDPWLDKLRHDLADAVQSERVRTNARLAAKTISANPHDFRIADAIRAVQALQAFIDNERKTVTND